jgi:mycofactocin biosynthetic radical S-adenosylmethionine protein MftC
MFTSYISPKSRSFLKRLGREEFKMAGEIQKIFEKIHDSRHLLYASLELTFSCNFACRFCYNPVDRFGNGRNAGVPQLAGNRLELDEIFALLKNLRKAGVLYFTLTGGEPMVHPHFWEILEQAKKEAFVLRIFTNGALVDEESAKRIGNICPNCVELSLYGASEESYEKSSGRGSAYPKVMKALELLKREGINVYLKCLLTSVTEKEIDEIQDIADKFRYPLSWDPVMQMSDDGGEYPLKMSASEESIEKLLTNPRFRVGGSPFEGEERQSACNIGRNIIHIDPFGNIYPCIAWREPLGNVRTDDIAGLWKNSGRFQELMNLSKVMAEKIKASGIDCRHCMGNARHLYNDPLRFDESELKISRIRNKVKG